MADEKFVGRNVVLQLGNAVAVLKRVKTVKRQETVEYVAIDCDTLKTIGIYTKDGLQEMLEDREWQARVAEREAKKASSSKISAVLDGDDSAEEDEDEESPQFGQQPPV